MRILARHLLKSEPEVFMLNSQVNLVDLDGTAANQGTHFNDQPSNDDVTDVTASDTTRTEDSAAEAEIAGVTTEEQVRDALNTSTDGTAPASAQR